MVRGRTARSVRELVEEGEGSEMKDALSRVLRIRLPAPVTVEDWGVGGVMGGSCGGYGRDAMRERLFGGVR